jgi:ParB/RepB/Spo0J family partition protein
MPELALPDLLTMAAVPPPVLIQSRVDDIEPVSEDATPELIESVRRFGVLVPVALNVAYDLSQPMQVVAGRRRVAAARAVGLTIIPSYIYTGLTAAARSALTLTENMVRSANPVGELHAIERLLVEGLTEEQVASELQIPIQRLRARLRLLSLITPLRTALEQGLMVATVAHAAARLTPSQQGQLARSLETRELTRIGMPDVQAVTRVAADAVLQLLPDTAFEAAPPAPVTVASADVVYGTMIVGFSNGLVTSVPVPAQPASPPVALDVVDDHQYLQVVLADGTRQGLPGPSIPGRYMMEWFGRDTTSRLVERNIGTRVEMEVPSLNVALPSTRLTLDTLDDQWELRGGGLNATFAMLAVSADAAQRIQERALLSEPEPVRLVVSAESATTVMQMADGTSRTISAPVELRDGNGQPPRAVVPTALRRFLDEVGLGNRQRERLNRILASVNDLPTGESVPTRSPSELAVQGGWSAVQELLTMAEQSAPNRTDAASDAFGVAIQALQQLALRASALAAQEAVHA